MIKINGGKGRCGAFADGVRYMRILVKASVSGGKVNFTDGGANVILIELAD